jgi:DNA-binding NtrC family response regulator
MTRVVIVGAGGGGKALVELLRKDPTKSTRMHRVAEYFLQRARAKVNKHVESIAPQAIELLRNYSWPGNLRELENVIERAVVLTSSSLIEAEHLPLHVQDLPGFKPQKGFMASKSLAIQQLERQALVTYLSEAKGNVSRAAVLANLSRRIFHRLMAKYNLARRRACL